MAFATASTLDKHAPGVVAAVDAVSTDLVPTALRMGRHRVGNGAVWGEDQADAHACLALHWLERCGHLSAAGYEAEGEHGTLRKRTTTGGSGSNTYEFEALAVSVGDSMLASTPWGRTYLQIWQAKRGGVGALVL